MDTERGNRSGSLYPLTFVLLLLPFALGACGLLFTHGPPADSEHLNEFRCTHSNTGPIVDLVWGGLNLADAASISANADQYQNPGQAEASSAFWGILSVLSAGVGFDKVSRCVAAKRELAERLAKAPPATAATAQPDGAPDIRTVQITPTVDTLDVGGGVQLLASAVTSSGATVVDPRFAWSSSNDAIASVSNSGRVTAHAPGTAIIAPNARNVVGIAGIVVMSGR